MIGYRCYILDADDHILQAHELECASDAEATVSAERLLAGDPYQTAVEVWRLTQRIATLRRQADGGLAPGYPLGSRRMLGSVV